MAQVKTATLEKRDYFFITFIGIAFALFALPILKNLAIKSIPINATTAIGLVIFFGLFANIALFISGLIAKKIPVFLQVAKFAAVGAFNTFLNWGVVNILMVVTGIYKGFWYSAFIGVAFLAANSGSYFWNKYWTFTDNTESKKSKEGNFLQFFGVTLIGFFATLIIATVITNFVSHPASFTDARWANIGTAIGTLFGLVCNFIGYKFFVFKK
ncbi:MAG TPA: GtrA family protein [Patescibacteria group bacterium]